MHSPCVPHWTAAKRILCYLNHTRHHGLFFSVSSSFTLSAFSYVDWAGCPDDRRSTRGFCIYFSSHLLSWGSKKHPTVARSSIEAGYKAIANTVCELLWLQSLFSKLGVSLTKPSTLWCDDIGATYLSLNLVMHSKTKHVALGYGFVCVRVTTKSLQVLFISTKD